ncbi:MAG: hypothetical protein ACYC0X_04095 [Pirellulaceae bacterium]
MKQSLHILLALGMLAGILAFGSQRLLADGGKIKRQLRLLLVPTESNDQVKVVPAGDAIPKNGTMVVCDGIRFSSDGLVFEHAVIETNDHRTTASQVTLVTNDASLRFSADHKIFFKTDKGKEDLHRALQQ